MLVFGEIKVSVAVSILFDEAVPVTLLTHALGDITNIAGNAKLDTGGQRVVVQLPAPQHHLMAQASWGAGVCRARHHLRPAGF